MMTRYDSMKRTTDEIKRHLRHICELINDARELSPDMSISAQTLLISAADRLDILLSELMPDLGLEIDGLPPEKEEEHD